MERRTRLREDCHEVAGAQVAHGPRRRGARCRVQCRDGCIAREAACSGKIDFLTSLQMVNRTLGSSLTATRRKPRGASRMAKHAKRQATCFAVIAATTGQFTRRPDNQGGSLST